MRAFHLTALLPLLLAACGQNGLSDLITDRPAGAHLDQGVFGAATMTNTLVQSGAVDYRVSLAHRFDAEVPSTVNFAFNSTALDGEARAALRAQADWIRQFPEVRFRVYGHTDLVGGRAYNHRLGQQRAEAVVLYLVSQGIGRDRLEAMVSHGETQPLIVTEGRERRNRRTVTEVSGFVESHPMILNGKYAEVIFREYLVGALPEHRVTSGEVPSGSGGD